MEAAGGVLCIKLLGIPLVPCAVAGNGEGSLLGAHFTAVSASYRGARRDMQHCRNPCGFGGGRGVEHGRKTELRKGGGGGKARHPV